LRVIARETRRRAARRDRAGRGRAAGDGIEVAAEGAREAGDSPPALARHVSLVAVAYRIADQDLRVRRRDPAVDAVAEGDAALGEVELEDAVVRTKIRKVIAAAPGAGDLDDFDGHRLLVGREAQPGQIQIEVEVGLRLTLGRVQLACDGAPLHNGDDVRLDAQQLWGPHEAAGGAQLDGEFARRAGHAADVEKESAGGEQSARRIGGDAEL